MDRDRTWLAPTIFLVGSAVAGGNAVAVRFSNRELDPMWGATLRFSLAALVMITAMIVLKQRIPRGRALVGAALYGLFSFGGGFALAFYALVELEAGFGQILLSVVPLATLLLATAQRQEKATVAGLVGALVAISGVVVMSGFSLDGDIPVLAIAAALGAAACFAQGSIVVRHYPHVHPVSLNAVGMVVGAAFLGVLTVVFGNAIALPADKATIVALVYMVFVGSGLTFTLYVVLLGLWSATRANYTFVLVPVFTVAISAWLLDERINAAFIVGGVLVVAGVYIGALRQAGS